MRNILAGLLLAVSLTACASTGNTTLTTTYRNPQARPLDFHRVIATFVSNDDGVRREAESYLVTKFPVATASYNFFADGEMHNNDLARAKLAASGYDGVIVMRVTDIQHQTTYVPGNVYAYPNDFWGYWGNAWSVAYTPAYYRNDQLVTVETSVYSVPEGQLVWAGRSETMNPSSVRSLLHHVIDETRDELRKQGLR